MIILDRESHEAVTTEPDPNGNFKLVDGVYQGKYYGPEVYANTSLRWGDRSWSMVLWPLPEDKVDRTRLLMHEAFHSLQEPLGLQIQKNPINSHLDQEQDRILIRLEWNALLKALQDEPNRKVHLSAALTLRELRTGRAPAARLSEQELEINEGLAEYTGVRLQGGTPAETLRRLEDKLSKVPTVFSLTRSSAYYSGPLYGLLLDWQSDFWRKKLTKGKSLAQLTASFFNIRVPRSPRPLSEATLAQYDYPDIAKFEHDRALDIQARVKKYLAEINRPQRLELFMKDPMNMFDPYGILSAGPGKTIYTTYELRDVWGTLVVKNGTLVVTTPTSGTATVSPPTKMAGATAEGNGWTLKLNPGWKLVSRKDILKVEAE